jgi:predicted acylesterase/phospholipase RssA
MVKLMHSQEVEYDIIEGVSAGAINAGILATYPKGEEENAANLLADIWL